MKPVLEFARCQWDRVAAAAAFAGGALALILGYLGMSDSIFPAEQLPFLLSGGLVGLFLLGIGATAWLSADMRDEWRKLDDIYRALLDDPDSDVTIEADERMKSDRAPTPLRAEA